MSFFGSESKSSSMTYDQSATAAQGSIAASGGSTVNLLDGDAIQKSLEFSKDVLMGTLGLVDKSNTNAKLAGDYAMEKIAESKAPDMVFIQNITYWALGLGALYLIVKVVKK